jgi:hypothetical protein
VAIWEKFAPKFLASGITGRGFSFFQLFDIEKLVNFFHKFSKISRIYTRKTEISKILPNFLVEKTTEFLFGGGGEH